MSGDGGSAGSGNGEDNFVGVDYSNDVYDGLSANGYIDISNTITNRDDRTDDFHERAVQTEEEAVLDAIDKNPHNGMVDQRDVDTIDFDNDGLFGPADQEQLDNGRTPLFRKLSDQDNDTITGGDGDDVIRPGDGDDVVYGNGGDDFIRGGKGNDFIFGGLNNDTILGNSSHDVLTGGNGRDSIDGGIGNDMIAGSNGSDTLIGGAGKDLFIFQAESWVDRVRDFENGIDKLLVAGADSMSDLTVTQSGDNVVISSNDVTLILENTQRSEINADDFLL